ncbi:MULTISPECIES: TIGR03618 family F420-dependent PPOX class oxidoreductase [unclassified Streptomyces]|uniref:TIGR03618 family F420-dependent PPOX class oxidoreductase n=1 Tax=unclassified Streptomyces TaxID=2593676 RepID=UPI002E188D5A|nr:MULTISPECIES: TIGR03618 family F420-dependent PPOX class oxidoreductase [unclassified Streptomyces]
MAGSDLSQEALWQRVAGRREGVLATLGPDGTPHLSNVYYLADPATRILRLSTTTGRAKGRNLLRDPRAALYVPGEDFFNYTVAEGRFDVAVATVVGEPAIDELYAVHAASGAAGDRPAFDRRMIRHRRMLVRAEIRRLYGLVHPAA